MVALTESNKFIVKFDGGVAEAHALPAKDLSDALDGIEKIVSSFLAALTNNDVSQRRLREPGFQVVVEAPKKGSLDLVFMVQNLAAVALPLYPYLTDVALSKVSEHLLNSVLLYFSRKKKDSDDHMEKALSIISDLADKAYADKKDEREALYADRQRERQFLSELFQHQRETLEPAAKKAVAPVGRSCNSLQLSGPGTGSPVVIDATDALAIRGEKASLGKMIDDELSTVVVKLDGMRKSTRMLWAQSNDAGEGAGSFQVMIIDPEYDSEDPSSVYEVALANRNPIILTGLAERNVAGDVTRFFAKSGKLTSE